MRAFKTLLMMLFAFGSSSFQSGKQAMLNKAEAQRAFQYLNEIRTNPAKFRHKFSFLAQHKIRKTELVWNERLAKVAETKASDMANRNYFSHVDPEGYGINYYIHKGGYKLSKDWLRNKSSNNFESLAYGLQEGETTINTLLTDKGVPGLGHRKHLLGIGDWNSSLTDIGIGFARIDRNAGYPETYVCIIIAKHDW
ncbi:MAG: CAP domain-containing protein [Sphingobacteriales bacterium]|nr:MAG: CAP domain-containing protein [Sphingobacteriales bacterium]